MRPTITVTDMARNFAEYINRVAYRGERFLLTRGNKVVAEIRPVPEARSLSELPGLLSALPRLPEEDAAAFAEEWQSGREGLEPLGGEERWES